MFANFSSAWGTSTWRVLDYWRLDRLNAALAWTSFAALTLAKIRFALWNALLIFLLFISFSLFAKQRERNEPKKEKARKRSLHFANAQCLNIIWAFSSNSFKAHYRTSCTFAWLTYVSNRWQFCVCVSTIAKPKRFCERSEQNVRPFGQSDAAGSAEIFCGFFSFGSFSLFASQSKRENEQINYITYVCGR